MKIKGINHIAIATKDINATIKLYEKLFNTNSSKPLEVLDQGVISAYIPIQGTGIEILQPIDQNGAIQKFINKKGEGFHHVAVNVDSIEKSINELSADGIRLILGTANGKTTAFIHPKCTGGVLVELCE